MIKRYEAMCCVEVLDELRKEFKKTQQMVYHGGEDSFGDDLGDNIYSIEKAISLVTSRYLALRGTR